MRKFSIQNQYGEKIELQGGSIFFHTPSGLGYADNTEYMEAEGFFIKTYSEPAQVEKTGTILFKPSDAYKSYFDFANWVLGAEQLTLGYDPFGTQFYVDVDLVSMEKGELGVGGTLEIPVVLKPTSPIYSPLNLNLRIGGYDQGGFKLYAYRYPYRYATSAVSGVLEFEVDAQIASDFEMIIKGPINAPVITAVRQDTGATLGKVDLSSVTVETGETLVFSTVPKEAGATLKQGDTSTDLTENLGLESGVPTFFQLPANVPIKMTLDAESLVGVTADLRVYRYYRTV